MSPLEGCLKAPRSNQLKTKLSGEQTFTLRAELTHKNIFSPLTSDTVALSNRNQFELRFEEIPQLNLYSGHILRLCGPILLFVRQLHAQSKCLNSNGLYFQLMASGSFQTLIQWLMQQVTSDLMRFLKLN